MGTQSSWQGERSAYNNGLMDQARGAVSELADTAKETVGSQIGSKKGRLSEQISEVAQALRDTGSRLGENAQSAVAAGYVDKAASQVERIADYVESRDVADIVAEVKDLARREPAAFFGGLFALGLVAGRLLKSSAPADTGATRASSRDWEAGRQSFNAGGQPRRWTESSQQDEQRRGASFQDGDQASRQGAGDRRDAVQPNQQAGGGIGSALGGPQQQANPDVIAPAPVREVGTDEGTSGAASASSRTGAREGAAAKPSREPRGGSSGGAT
jgi:hypothetical protein